LPTQTQQWARSYSRHLADSFLGSQGIEHAVTTGDARENQIFSALDKLLPTPYSVYQKAVVMDEDSKQSDSFDGVFVDRAGWPILYEEGVVVVMAESVKLLGEVKSELNEAEIDDICKKLSSMKSLKVQTPPAFCFAYSSTNTNLNYLDLLIRFSLRQPVPSVVCVLNQALIAQVPSISQVPVFVKGDEDSLLLMLHHLVGLIRGHQTAEAYRRYSRELFDNVHAIGPPSDLVPKLRDPARRRAIRNSFVYKSATDLHQMLVATSTM
jgi:hypothetical protein